ncbi:MAG: ABC transporter ATP-binding protein [Candidatus Eremiobacteraeota bacterium]|nr:ABC transporter ATP-binding protein [Candidatus Eremiobacteraeota bacterium]
MAELCVNVEGLTKKFGDFTAVDSVDFQIPRGSIFGFLGPNGAGKSTVIRMLLGIIPPSQGQGQVLGRDIRTQADEIRARVGYMAQKFSLYEDLTVRENLDFFAGLFGSDRVDQTIETARLGEYVDQTARSLPGGARQRLALGVALVHDPELIFLDEPTGAVDPALRRYFWELIVKMSRAGKTIMVTSHYMDEVERCDTICFIHSGKLIARGSPGELKRKTLRGEMLSLTVKDRNRALQVLGAIEGVGHPFPSGPTVRFTYDGDRTQLKARLQEQGLPEPRSASPNLEDVFVSLTQGGP